MKKFLLSIITVIIIFHSHGQKIDYNLDNGYVAEGFDVVAYFDNNPMEGKEQYNHTYQGAQYKFSSQANLDKFKASPNKYVPQYGGWCAYAMGAKNNKVSIDPETYEIREGKLYLFYNSWGTNTLKSWKNEGPEKLKQQADSNWEKIKFK